MRERKNIFFPMTPQKWRLIIVNRVMEDLSFNSLGTKSADVRLTIYFLFRMKIWFTFQSLTHISPVSRKRDICKQCRPNSDAAERDV